MVEDKPIVYLSKDRLTPVEDLALLKINDLDLWRGATNKLTVHRGQSGTHFQTSRPQPEHSHKHSHRHMLSSLKRLVSYPKAT